MSQSDTDRLEPRLTSNKAFEAKWLENHNTTNPMFMPSLNRIEFETAKEFWDAGIEYSEDHDEDR